MSFVDPNLLAAQALNRRAEAGLLRQRSPLSSTSATRVFKDGRELICFCSNDYLDLSHHPRVIEAAARSARDHGVGAGASPLITGYTDTHRACESALARWKNTQAAALFPSGYQANIAGVQALAAIAAQNDQKPIFLMDKLAHASLIDAVRTTGATFRTFAHQDYGRLGELIDRFADHLPIVLTESVFSMDGDVLDVGGLARLKARSAFILVVDEAHGSGVYGPGGAGWLSECNAGGLADMTIVTLSKALGCAGGAICASEQLIGAVVNFGRAYVYSTSPSPTLASAVMAAIQVIQEEPHRADRLRQLARRVRARLRACCPRLPLLGADDSPILPVVFHTEQAAIDAAAHLFNDGLLALPIRPPTVPKGTSRLRLTLSSAHTDEQIDRLLDSLQRLKGT